MANKANKGNSKFKIKYLFGNSAGFSIAESMVALGMLGVITMGTLSVVGKQNETMGQYQNNIEEVNLYRQMFKILSDDQYCQTSLVTFPSSSGSPLKIGDEVLKLVGPGGAGYPEFASGGDYGPVGNSIRIKKMQLTPYPGAIGNDVANLVVITETKRKVDNKDIGIIKSRTIPVKIALDSQNNIIACRGAVNAYRETVNQEFCRALKGSWDEGTVDTQPVCRLPGAGIASNIKASDAVSVGYAQRVFKAKISQISCASGTYFQGYNIDGSAKCSAYIAASRAPVARPAAPARAPVAPRGGVTIRNLPAASSAPAPAPAVIYNNNTTTVRTIHSLSVVPVGPAPALVRPLDSRCTQTCGARGGVWTANGGGARSTAGGGVMGGSMNSCVCNR